jgi:hypothetical protein
MTRIELIKAFEMRLDGYSYQAIGDELGYTRQNVNECINSVIREQAKKWVYPNLVKEIKRLDESIESFCEKNNLKAPHFERMLHGRAKPTANEVLKCCEVFKKDCLYLFAKKE